MKNLPWLVGEPVPRIFGQLPLRFRRDYPIEEYLAGHPRLWGGPGPSNVQVNLDSPTGSKRNALGTRRRQ